MTTMQASPTVPSILTLDTPVTATVAARSRGGAPARNQNAVSSGLSSLAGSGRVPTKLKGGLYIRRQVRTLRREIASEFVAIAGREPGIHEHVVLKVMARAEARAMLHERMLADDWDELTHEQRTVSLAAIGTAGDQLIRCSKELGLNRRADGGNLQERLKRIRAKQAAQQEAGDPIATPPVPDAPEATPERDSDTVDGVDAGKKVHAADENQESACLADTRREEMTTDVTDNR